MPHCIFCDIVAGKAAADILFRDERALAFTDIHPQAPRHLLVIPARHIRSLEQCAAEDEGLLGHLLLVGARLAREVGLAATGYRTVINTGAQAGQTVFHLHVHILGGRPLRWPPG